MTRFVREALLASLAAVAILAASPTAANAEKQSRRVSGHIHFDVIDRGPSCPSPVASCWRATYTGGIEGVGKTVVQRYLPSDPENVHFIQEDEVIHTNDGDITAKVSAAYDSTSPEKYFASLHVITGGTGKYAGASGWLQLTGVATNAGRSAEADYVGVIVTGQ